MLVLTRKQQEKIRIGDDITITILKTKGKAVRLGIEAPANVPVVRGELLFQTDSSAPDHAAPIDNEVSDHVSSFAPKSQPRVRQSNWNSDGNAVLQRVSLTQADKLRGPLRAMLDSRTGASG